MTAYWKTVLIFQFHPLVFKNVCWNLDNKFPSFSLSVSCSCSIIGSVECLLLVVNEFTIYWNSFRDCISHLRRRPLCSQHLSESEGPSQKPTSIVSLTFPHPSLFIEEVGLHEHVQSNNWEEEWNHHRRLRLHRLLGLWLGSTAQWPQSRRYLNTAGSQEGGREAWLLAAFGRMRLLHRIVTPTSGEEAFGRW